MNQFEALGHFLERFQQILAAGLVSMFGGVAAYIYQNVKNETKFSFSAFFVISFLAFFAGNLVGSFLPSDFDYRDGILMLTGFVSFPLLGLLEVKGKNIIMRIIEHRIFPHQKSSLSNDDTIHSNDESDNNNSQYPR